MQVQMVGENYRPVLRIKNRGGAPFGNRNALKHGWYTAEKLASARAVKKELAQMKLLCARVKAHVALANLFIRNRSAAETILRGGEASGCRDMG